MDGEKRRPATRSEMVLPAIGQLINSHNSGSWDCIPIAVEACIACRACLFMKRTPKVGKGNSHEVTSATPILEFYDTGDTLAAELT